MPLFWVNLMIYGVAALVATRVPLLNTLGYEFSMLMAAINVVLAPIGAGAFSLSRRLLLHLSFLLLPLLIISLHDLRSGACGYLDGLAFFLLIPAVTVVLTTVVSDFCVRQFSKRWQAVLLYSAVVLTTAFLTVLRLYLGVATYAFNPFFGYFPGPIYDAALSVDQRLLCYRLFTLLLAGWWLCLTRRTYKLLVVATLAIVAVAALQNQFGFYTTRRYLQQQLGQQKIGKGWVLVYDQRLTTSEFDVDNFIVDVDYWIAAIASELKTEAKPITVYVYKDARQKKRLTGAAYTLIGNPIHREVHLLPTRFPNTILQHELTHVVAAGFGLPFLGVGRSFGLLEGLAVAVERMQGRYTLHAWARAILEDKGKTIDLAALMQTFAFFTQASQKSYLLAGSFVRFLIDQYGVAEFQKVYRSGDYLAVYGRSLADLLQQWQTFLATVSLDATARQQMAQTLKRKGLFEERCPHSSANWRDAGYTALAARRFPEALGCFMKSYHYSGGGGNDLQGLLQSRYRQLRSQNVTGEDVASVELQLHGLSLRLRQRGEYLLSAWSSLGFLASQEGFADLAEAAFQKVFEIDGNVDAWLLWCWAIDGHLDWIVQFFNFDEAGERQAFVEAEFLRSPIVEPGAKRVAEIWSALQTLSQANMRSPSVTETNTVAAVLLLRGIAEDELPDLLNEQRCRLLGEYYYRHQDIGRATLYFSVYSDDPVARVWRQRIIHEH